MTEVERVRGRLREIWEEDGFIPIGLTIPAERFRRLEAEVVRPSVPWGGFVALAESVVVMVDQVPIYPGTADDP